MNDVNRESGARPEPAVRPVLSGPPSGYFLVVPQSQAEQSVSLGAVFTAVMRAWRLVLAAMVIAAIVAAAITIPMPKMFRGKVIVAPVSQNESVGGGSLRSAVSNELGGLASLAGIDLSGEDARKQQFFATLTSAEFARNFIAAENLLPGMFPDRWDAKRGTWRAGVQAPTLNAGARMLTSRYRTIKEDRKTGMVTVTFDWYTPQLAAQYANRTIEMVNDQLRNEAIHQAQLSSEYLNKELARTNVVGVQQGIYQLIEEQIGKSMLANVQHDYAYRFIDPAVPADRKASPQRVLITAIGALAGLILSLAYVLLGRNTRPVRT